MQKKFDWFWIGTPLTVALLPLLFVSFAPMLDWPLHLSQGVLISSIQDTSFLPQGVYCQASFQPYHLFHYLVAGWSQFIPAEWLSQTTLCILFGFYVLSIFTFLRSFRVDRKWVIVSFPMFFGYTYLMGFAPNLLGFSFLFFSLSAFQDWLTKENLRAAVFFVLFSLLTWLSHPLPFFLGIFLGFSLLLAKRGVSLKSVCQYFLVTLPLLCATIYQLFYFQKMGRFQTWWYGLLPGNKQSMEKHGLAFGDSIWTRLKLAPSYLLGNKGLSGHLFQLSLVLLIILSLSFLIKVAIRKDKSWKAVASLFFVSFSFYVFLPNALMKGNNAYPRFVQVAFLCLLLAMPRVKGKRTFFLFVCCWFLSISFLFKNLEAQMAWDGSYRDLKKLMQKLPNNSRYMTLLANYRNAATWIQVFRGGEARYSFSHHFHMPVQDCNPKAQIPTYHLSRHPHRFLPSRHKQYADFLILYQRSSRSMIRLYPWLILQQHPYKMIAKSGRWLLLKKDPPHTKKTVVPRPKQRPSDPRK